MEFNRVHARFPEKQGFSLTREDTGKEFIFLHFLTPGRLFLNGCTFDMQRGACIFIPNHSYYTISTPDCDLLHDWFHAVGNVDSLLAEYGLEFERVYYPAEHQFITDLISTIQTERSMKYPFHERLCALLGEQLVAKLARLCASPESISVSAETYKVLCNLRERLHASLSEDWSVEKMAAETNFSPSYFHSIYRSVFGISPKHDLLRLRLRHAKALLAHSNLTMTEGAQQSGFRSNFHFIRSFRTAFNITPNQYRIVKRDK